MITNFLNLMSSIIGVTGYRPPGVYPQYITDSAPISTIQGQRIPVIIGTGAQGLPITVVVTKGDDDGTDTLPSDSPAMLTGAGYTPIVGDREGAAKYRMTTDFVPAVGPPPTISWSPARHQPVTGQVYYVTYYATATDIVSNLLDFHIYNNESDVRKYHGDESLLNTVSLGAILALRNGAPAVGVLQLDCTPQADYNTKHDAFVDDALPILELLDLDECRFVVPMTCLGVKYPEGYDNDDTEDTNLTNNNDIWYNYLDHVVKMSATSERRWRMLVRGLAPYAGLDTTDPSNKTNTKIRDDAKIQVTAQSEWGLDLRRLVMVAPGEVYRSAYTPSTNVWAKQLYPGYALAAAIAGKVCSYTNPAIPLTNKTISGLTISRRMSSSDLNMMASKGVCLCTYKGADLRCRHALTAAAQLSASNANNQEMSVVEIEDYLKVRSIMRLEDDYVGSTNTPETLLGMKMSVQSLWEDMVLLGAISEYDAKSISVEEDATDPRTINIYGRVKPAYPITWIDMSFSFYASAISS